jgi:hypothetical protein
VIAAKIRYGKIHPAVIAMPSCDALPALPISSLSCLGVDLRISL